jgi:transketolase
MGGITFNMEVMIAMRDVVGNHLVELGDRYPNMIVATADVDTSSRVIAFKEKFPDRAYNTGIAEQDLMSFAAGMAIEGYIPFVFSFAPFASMRACEQVRTDICYSNLPVKIIANGAGYSNGISGATHCALEDSAIMTSFGNMTVIEPGDPFLAAKMLEASMDWKGPIYIRLGREAVTALYPENTKYEIGKALIPHDGDDGAFIAAGVVVHHAIEAAKRIKDELGKHIRVVDMHTIKPLDKDAVIGAAKTGRVICAQDHNIIGGLGYAVGAVIAEAGIATKYKILGCPDKFVPLATPEFLYKENEYDADGLYKNMKAMLA